MFPQNTIRSFTQLGALLFDMDGLLLDTERVSKQAWQLAAQEEGFVLSNELYFQCLGRTSPEVERIIREALGEKFPIDTVRQRRQEIVETQFMLDGVAIKPGARALLEYATQRQLKLALATSTPKERALLRLRQSTLDSFFEVVVGGDEIVHGKPAPDIYLRAAHLLGVAAEHCLVLEDSEAGVAAAAAAGMRVVVVPDLKQPSDETRLKATLLLQSLEEVRAYL